MFAVLTACKSILSSNLRSPCRNSLVCCAVYVRPAQFQPDTAGLSSVRLAVLTGPHCPVTGLITRFALLSCEHRKATFSKAGHHGIAFSTRYKLWFCRSPRSCSGPAWTRSPPSPPPSRAWRPAATAAAARHRTTPHPPTALTRRRGCRWRPATASLRQGCSMQISSAITAAGSEKQCRR